jgi:hypothetical protein
MVAGWSVVGEKSSRRAQLLYSGGGREIFAAGRVSAQASQAVKNLGALDANMD